MASMAGGSKHADHMHGLLIIGGAMVCIIVMVMVSRMARKALAQAVASPARAEPGKQTP